MTKLPDTRGTVNTRIAKLRRVTNKPERLDQHVVTYERIDPGRPFEIATVSKDEGQGADAGTASAAARAATYPGSMISIKGLACPWCGARGTIYHEDCATTWCSGAGRNADGVRRFTCPRCGEDFETETADEKHGLREGKAAGAVAGLLGGAASFLRLGRK